VSAAFDEVASEAALGKAVVVVRRPVKFVHQWRQDHGAVRHAAGDDNVRPLFQCTDNARRAQIRVEADHHAGQGSVGVDLGDAGFRELALLRHQVVAQDHPDLQVESLFIHQCLECIPAGNGVLHHRRC